MKYLLIILSLLAVSCAKDNSVEVDPRLYPNGLYEFTGYFMDLHTGSETTVDADCDAYDLFDEINIQSTAGYVEIEGTQLPYENHLFKVFVLKANQSVIIQHGSGCYMRYVLK